VKYDILLLLKPSLKYQENCLIRLKKMLSGDIITINEWLNNHFFKNN
jgi:hypothetical protein